MCPCLDSVYDCQVMGTYFYYHAILLDCTYAMDGSVCTQTDLGILRFGSSFLQDVHCAADFIY